MKRTSGILMPMSSLPSPYGIGTMGKSAYDFVDFLHASGQSYWQLLPLGPTSYGDSPYQSFSTFAGNPYFIDLEMLMEDGLLEKSEAEESYWGTNPEYVDYPAVYKNRFKLLRLAFSRGRDKLRAEIECFKAENPWLGNYALYMSVKAHFDMVSWNEWPDDDIRLHKAEAVEKYSKLLAGDMEFYVFIQFLFYRQWDELRDYAHSKGIRFIGDVPIYVAMDSADVWSEPQFFMLDKDNKPTFVAGVPPDAFTDEGQLWGNPLYNWDKMQSDGYGWWIRRIDGARKLYDVIRIDHFRGFDTYWAVPAGDKTATSGKWLPGPGMKLVGVLTSWFYQLEFIAEDLGIINDSVRKLLTDSGLPGMKVLEFAFDSKSDGEYLPHNCKYNSICYIGTHDNDTVMGWLNDTDDEDRDFARRYMNITEDEGWCWGLIRTGMATPCRLFVTQMQDVLELPHSARMNTPGTLGFNWQWRMRPDAITDELTEKLLRYTLTYRRTALPEAKEDMGDDEASENSGVKTE